MTLMIKLIIAGVVITIIIITIVVLYFVFKKKKTTDSGDSDDSTDTGDSDTSGDSGDGDDEGDDDEDEGDDEEEDTAKEDKKDTKTKGKKGPKKFTDIVAVAKNPFALTIPDSLSIPRDEDGIPIIKNADVISQKDLVKQLEEDQKKFSKNQADALKKATFRVGGFPPNAQDIKDLKAKQKEAQAKFHQEQMDLLKFNEEFGSVPGALTLFKFHVKQLKLNKVSSMMGKGLGPFGRPGTKKPGEKRETQAQMKKRLDEEMKQYLLANGFKVK